VPAGKGRKGMELAGFTVTTSPLSFLHMYTLYVPANRYDWHKYRNALHLKNSSYGMGGTCNMNGGYKKRYKNLKVKGPFGAPNVGEGIILKMIQQKYNYTL